MLRLGHLEDHGTFQELEVTWVEAQKMGLCGRQEIEPGHKATGACGSSSQVTVPRAALELPTLKPQEDWVALAKGLRTAQRKPGTPR